MQTPETTQDLLEILTRNQQPEESTEISKNYRYVIYARKSTDDKDKQTRSLTDQIMECKDHAELHNLKLGSPDVIQEAESAKEPDTRPRFRQMINDIKSGKYDGIIAWHPDRLARNMKDAGEIIDLVDKHIIKSLKFVSFSFEDTPSGKMLLGVTFVLSKQYSDQLSENVSRGNRRSIEEGKYVNRAKHGYYKDSNQYLRPDHPNFLFIKNAFGLRLAGNTLDEIASYLNEAGYQRFNKDGSHSVYKWNKQKVDEYLMRDPVYAGVVVYGEHGGSVDLTKQYDFVPAISVSDFMRIHKLSRNSDLLRLARNYYKGDDVRANLLRGIVFCATCGAYMSTGITSKPKQNKNYFYFRCVTNDCEQRPRSVRAKIIIDYVKSFLEQKPFSSKEAYNHYAKEMVRVSRERDLNNRKILLSQNALKSKLDKKVTEIKEGIVRETDENIKEMFRGDLRKAKEQYDSMVKNIEKTQESIKSDGSTVITYEKFVELMENMAININTSGKMEYLDFVIKKMFSNFTVDGKKVTKATLNEPFNTLSTIKVLDCGR